MLWSSSNSACVRKQLKPLPLNAVLPCLWPPPRTASHSQVKEGPQCARILDSGGCRGHIFRTCLPQTSSPGA